MDKVELHLRHLEEQLLDPVVRKDRAYVSSLLADDFREFGSSGRILYKEDILAELASGAAASLTLEDFQAKRLASDVFLVTYRALRHSPDGVLVTSLRSSLWMLRDARWQMLFHQGTKIC